MKDKKLKGFHTYPIESMNVNGKIEYYFWDETWSENIGPWESEEEALFELGKYCTKLGSEKSSDEKFYMRDLKLIHEYGEKGPFTTIHCAIGPGEDNQDETITFHQKGEKMMYVSLLGYLHPAEQYARMFEGLANKIREDFIKEDKL